MPINRIRASDPSTTTSIESISQPASPPPEEFSPENIRAVAHNLLTPREAINPLRDPLEMPTAVAQILTSNPAVSTEVLPLAAREVNTVQIVTSHLVATMAQQPASSRTDESTHHDDMFKSLDGAKLKTLFENEIFKHITDETSIGGHKFATPLAKAFRPSIATQDVGFTSQEQLDEFLKVLRPLINRDKVQSKSEWKAEIFNILDRVFLQEHADYTAMNENVFMVTSTGEATVVTKKEWQEMRLIALDLLRILSQPQDTTTEDKKDDDRLNAQALSRNRSQTKLSDFKDLDSKKSEESPVAEVLKEQRELQEIENKNLINKQRFEEQIRIRQKEIEGG